MAEKDGWILIETLGHDRTTAVGKDGRAKNRTAIGRAIKENVGGRLAAAVSVWAASQIESVRRTATKFDVVAELISGHPKTRLILCPVLGTDGVVHGVHLWAGPQGDSPDGPPRACAAFGWSSELRLFEPTEEVRKILGVGLDSGRTTLTAPELFRSVHFDDAMTLIGKALAARPEDSWDGLASLRTADGPKTVHVVMISRAAPDEHVWRGLVHDVSDTTEPSVGSLEAATLAAMPRVASTTAMALLDVTRGRLIRWITDPIPGIQWKGIVDNRDAPHPQDVERIFAAAAEILSGKTTQGAVQGVRLRRFAGGWTIVDGVGALLEQNRGPKLLLIEMRIVGESDEPDPVPPTDTGHPGLQTDG